jgi:hypothetical protein
MVLPGICASTGPEAVIQKAKQAAIKCQAIPFSPLISCSSISYLPHVGAPDW